MTRNSFVAEVTFKSYIFWQLASQLVFDIFLSNNHVIVSSRVGTTLFWGYPRFFEANLKGYPPLFESHPNWCMEIVTNTFKWRCYVLYYPKSIENIINITLFTFRLNSVFTTDTFFGWILPLMFFIFDIQEKWS